MDLHFGGAAWSILWVSPRDCGLLMQCQNNAHSSLASNRWWRQGISRSLWLLGEHCWWCRRICWCWSCGWCWVRSISPDLWPNLELCDIFLEANVVLVVANLPADYAVVSKESRLGVNTSCDVDDIDCEQDRPYHCAMGYCIWAGCLVRLDSFWIPGTVNLMLSIAGTDGVTRSGSPSSLWWRLIQRESWEY